MSFFKKITVLIIKILQINLQKVRLQCFFLCESENRLYHMCCVALSISTSIHQSNGGTSIVEAQPSHSLILTVFFFLFSWTLLIRFSFEYNTYFPLSVCFVESNIISVNFIYFTSVWEYICAASVEDKKLMRPFGDFAPPGLMCLKSGLNGPF